MAHNVPPNGLVGEQRQFAKGAARRITGDLVLTSFGLGAEDADPAAQKDHEVPGELALADKNLTLVQVKFVGAIEAFQVRIGEGRKDGNIPQKGEVLRGEFEGRRGCEECDARRFGLSAHDCFVLIASPDTGAQIGWRWSPRRLRMRSVLQSRSEHLRRRRFLEHWFQGDTDRDP